jgi:Concanavalin A-like lectin/glucanases superfamily
LGIFLFGIALPLVAFSAWGEPAGSGLVAHWKFEEGSGDTAKDSSGNGNDGTIVPANAPEPKWGTGEFAGSVSLGGGTDYHVRIPASDSLNKLKRQITVVAHIYPRILWTPPSVVQRIWREAIHLVKKLLGMTTNSEDTGYISVLQRQWRETAHPDLYYLGYGPENNVLHYKWHLGLIGAEVSLYRLPKGQDKPVVGEWVHLAGTYNGETGKMALYVNGKLIGTETHVGEIRLDPESLNRPLMIGAELNGPNIDEVEGEFNGYVDEVRIYDRALSDEEIETLAEEARKQVTK